jgi:hypothetical protein
MTKISPASRAYGHSAANTVALTATPTKAKPTRRRFIRNPSGFPVAKK